MWKHREPDPEDYEYSDEYLAALEAYNRAEEEHIESYIERRREREEI